MNKKKEGATSVPKGYLWLFVQGMQSIAVDHRQQRRRLACYKSSPIEVEPDASYF